MEGLTTPRSPRLPRIRRRAAWLIFPACGVFCSHGLDAQNIVPPPVTILQNSAQVASGYIFLTPDGEEASPPGETVEPGAEIVDNLGRPVWFLPTPIPGQVGDLRVQTYLGQTVLTWSQGVGFANLTTGATTNYVADTTYKVIASFQAGNGYNADSHEFQLTPQGTALITIYDELPADLSSVGGPADRIVEEGTIQEINVATGQVIFQWHSYPAVALGESYYPVPTKAATAYDYFHINSIDVDTDGNLLVSSRHTWTVFKINRTTGAIMWRMGGKQSNYTLGPGLPFAWQHNAKMVDASTIRIFDNESDGESAPQMPATRVIWVSHNDTTMTATILKSYQHPAGLSVSSQGNAQPLPNGDTFVDWGNLGRYSEFDPNGNLIYDATQEGGYDSYRGYRFAWAGMPATPPTATVQDNGNGTLTVDAIWNGATQVATWEVTGGPGPGSTAVVQTAAWNGLNTPITVPGPLANVQVVALNSAGTVIGISGAPAIVTQPVSATVAAGATVAFAVQVTGPALAYQWSLNGSAISGATSPILVIGNAGSANAGTYTCTAVNSAGTVTTDGAALAVTTTSNPGRLVNCSVLGTVNGATTVGFVTGGPGTTGTENLLIRALGPALMPFGVTGVLPDPTLTVLQQSTQAVVAADTGWGSNFAAVTAADNATGAFALTNSASLDSALVANLPSRSAGYSVQVAGASGDSGQALAEIYDDTTGYTPGNPRLINLSCLAQMPAKQGLTAGFVIGGTTAKTVLVRASGPALAAYGVSGAMPDPQVSIQALGSSTILASNAGWGGNAQIAAAGSSVGAFPFTNASSSDSGVLLTLPPGAYAAQVSSASAAPGAALVEIYEVP